ncbi:MAG: hypothetical protein EBU66_04405 [Bacteroidetes bacterium]|nr:hypothetical protein [Bacteroidota bacterium]
MATPAPPPPAQTPAPGSTAPAGPAKAPDPKKYSRFNRDKFISQNADPLQTNNTVVNLRYPTDVGSQEFPHYVVFYPLVREGTDLGQKLLNSGKGVIFDQSDQNRADPENGAAAAGTAGAIIGATLGAAAGANIGANLLKNGGQMTGKGTTPTGGSMGVRAQLSKIFVEKGAAALGTVAGGLVGGAIGGATGVGMSSVAGEQRLVFGDAEIVLHVTDRVTHGYSANWETADLGGLVGAVASGKMSADSFMDSGGGIDFEKLSTGGGELGDYALRKLGKVAGIAGFDSLDNVIQATSKKVENPYKEQLFRSMGFRKFGFDYRFSPRTESEAIAVFGDPDNRKEQPGIIETFLKHMHPTRSQTGLFLTYPSEFLIIYYHRGVENVFVRKISNCALTDMTVDYGAEGFTTFANGCPTEATIRMQFTELETLTTDRIIGGF